MSKKRAAMVKAIGFSMPKNGPEFESTPPPDPGCQMMQSSPPGLLHFWAREFLYS